MFLLRLLSSSRKLFFTTQTLRCLTMTSKLKSDGAPKTSTTESSISTEESAKPETFAHMLRHSKFVEIGDPVGKVTAGLTSSQVIYYS